MSAKSIFNALDNLRVSRSEIKAIIISHEHSDHTRGVGAISPAPRAIRCDPEVRTESLEGGGASCAATPGGRGAGGVALLGAVAAALAAWRRGRSAPNS